MPKAMTGVGGRSILEEHGYRGCQVECHVADEGNGACREIKNGVAALNDAPLTNFSPMSWFRVTTTGIPCA